MDVSATYENPWIFNDKPFEDNDIQNYYGFIYLIINKITGQKYIGRKYFYSRKKPKGSKRRKTQFSDWKKYYSSSKELKQEILSHGKENFSREIISLHKTKGDTNYNETKILFRFNVLENKDYSNENILGRYFRNSINIEGRKINKKFVYLFY